MTGNKPVSGNRLLEMIISPMTPGGYNYGNFQYRLVPQTNEKDPDKDLQTNRSYYSHLSSQELLTGHRLITSISELGKSFKITTDFITFLELVFELDKDTKSITLVASSRSQPETFKLLSNIELLKALKNLGYGIYKKKSTRNSHQTEGYKLFWLTVKRHS
jgi:hypothetical protein